MNASDGYWIGWADTTANLAWTIGIVWSGGAPFDIASTGVLEAYYLNNCADLPNTTDMYFSQIEIQQGCPAWNDFCNVTAAACGEYDGYSYCNNDIGYWLSYTDPDSTVPLCSYGNVSRQTIYGYPNTLLTWTP